MDKYGLSVGLLDFCKGMDAHARRLAKPTTAASIVTAVVVVAWYRFIMTHRNGLSYYYLGPVANRGLFTNRA